MEQQKKKKRAVAFGLVAVVLIFWNLMQNTADQQKLKVACIGDELTFGTAVEEREDTKVHIRNSAFVAHEKLLPGTVTEIHGTGRKKISDR